MAAIDHSWQPLMRLAFFGSGAFAVPAAEALREAGHDIVLACTRPLRPAGRGRAPRPTAIGEWAASRGIMAHHPEDPGSPEFLRALTRLAPDAGVLADYACLLPDGILAIPRNGFLNIHPSLLPRWRGAAPVQRAIISGDQETGVCIMRMNEALDRGPVLLMKKVAIANSDTAASLSARLAKSGAGLICEALSRIGELQPLPALPVEESYARRIRKCEARIDWRHPAPAVDRWIRGLSPNPGAWGVIRGERVKLLDCRIAAGEGRPGEILDDELLVACGSGALRLRTLQRPGRKPMTHTALLRGFRIGPGDRFELP